MEIRDVWKDLDSEARSRLIKRTRTSVGYIEKLCGGHCCPSLEMAERLIAAEPRLTFEGFLAARRRRKKVNATRARRQG